MCLVIPLNCFSVCFFSLSFSSSVCASVSQPWSFRISDLCSTLYPCLMKGHDNYFSWLICLSASSFFSETPDQPMRCLATVWQRKISKLQRNLKQAPNPSPLQTNWQHLLETPNSMMRQSGQLWRSFHVSGNWRLDECDPSQASDATVHAAREDADESQTVQGGSRQFWEGAGPHGEDLFLLVALVLIGLCHQQVPVSA